MAFTDSFYADWQTISVGAAALSVLASAALIMLSRLFSLRNLEQVAKTEFVYAASTVLIVMMTIGIIELAEPRLGGESNSLSRCLYLSSFGLACNDPATFTGTNTIIDWMKLYMATPTQCVQRFMNVLYALAVPVDAMTTVYMEIFMSEHASGFGVKWISERISNATQSFAFYMYMFFLIVHMFNFIKYYAGFFFSIGVAMRAFPPTRGAGAYLMAISFGLYFVFPLSYVMIATLSLPHAQSNLITFNATASGDPGYTCSLPDVPDVRTYACGAANPERQFELGDQIRSNGDALVDMLTLRIDDFQRHLVHSICIFPMISFVVLLTFVLNTTQLFGGNIPEIGRGLVKLI
ncbi:MAG: hypothetical protein U0R44_03705 [Candidatus Micrarchaeia archaeon]